MLAVEPDWAVAQAMVEHLRRSVEEREIRGRLMDVLAAATHRPKQRAPGGIPLLKNHRAQPYILQALRERVSPDSGLHDGRADMRQGNRKHAATVAIGADTAGKTCW